ncbi:toll/interleukin-1 receptor domain-containing protein [Streptomyces zhihengii]|uniref:Toll/interleukin-1 receptor domain-containing protein n=1 Tax=Streptomyces zhihengii TaxID=1818004 RepID=A0ABS2UHZ4_9ACTN|nr:toll/interleukin-1 receptor domain-containing protein [Streptomyces zhihengii]MBM9617252.1 toll/interleukin-1 receptor domain-containing protein [Streptomyces zhihengii]
MKIFLSWSGVPSRACAERLASWLRYFSDEIEPFVSSESIRKGARGLDEIKKQLDESSFGIACVTRANLHAPWITFESGALSKEVDERRGQLVPFLLEGTHDDLEAASSPLRQFQSTRAHDEEDVLNMVRTINSVLRESANRHPDNTRVDGLFRKVWPELRDALAVIDLTADTPEQVLPRRSTEEILEDLTSLMREQITRITDLEQTVAALREEQTGPPRARSRFTGVYEEAPRPAPSPAVVADNEGHA